MVEEHERQQCLSERGRGRERGQFCGIGGTALVIVLGTSEIIIIVTIVIAP
jgi:hypothetical protein